MKNILCPYLCTLFNTVFRSRHFPRSWADGHIIPLHKTGSVNDVNNYRGITLLNCLCQQSPVKWAENYKMGRKLFYPC